MSTTLEHVAAQLAGLPPARWRHTQQVSEGGGTACSTQAAPTLAWPPTPAAEPAHPTEGSAFTAWWTSPERMATGAQYHGHRASYRAAFEAGMRAVAQVAAAAAVATLAVGLPGCGGSEEEEPACAPASAGPAASAPSTQPVQCSPEARQ